MLEAGGTFAETLRKVPRQPALAVADDEQAGDQAGRDQEAHDEGGDESFRDGRPKADQATDDQQAHQDQEVERALAENRAQPLGSGDVRLLTEQICAIEVAHFLGQDAVGEPGENHDVEELTEPVGLARIAEEDLPADGAHHEGEVEGDECQGVNEDVRLTDRAQAVAVVELDMREHDEQDDGEDSEGDQRPRIEQPVFEGRSRDRRLRRAASYDSTYQGGTAATGAIRRSFGGG